MSLVNTREFVSAAYLGKKISYVGLILEFGLVSRAASSEAPRIGEGGPSI